MKIVTVYEKQVTIDDNLLSDCWVRHPMYITWCFNWKWEKDWSKVGLLISVSENVCGVFKMCCFFHKVKLIAVRIEILLYNKIDEIFKLIKWSTLKYTPRSNENERNWHLKQFFHFF